MMRHNQLRTILPGLVANSHGGLAFQETDGDRDGLGLTQSGCWMSLS